MDGKVIIGTDLNTSPLEKKLQKLESKLSKQKLDLEVTFGNQEYLSMQLGKVLKQLDKIEEKKKKLASDKADITTQLAPIQEKINNKQSIGYNENILYEKLNPQLQEINKEEAKLTKEANKYNKEVEKLNQQLDKAEIKYQKQSEAIQQTEQDIIETKGAIAQANAEQNKGNLDLKSIGNSIQDVVKKVAKWGLAVFGVRSAYMFIRQSMSTLSQYNEKLASDIQYVRWALATALKPIIEAIVNLVYRLITYVIYIGKEWGLISKSADFSAKAFQKANKGVKDTNKSAKQLQKTLAGFDEMNVLQENGSVASGGGGGGIASPTMDLAKIEIPEWVDWIAKNKDTILKLLAQIGGAIAVAFAISKILDFTNGIEKIAKFLGNIGTTLGNMSSLQIFGIIMGLGITIWGIVEVIREINDENTNLIDVLNGVSDAIIGIGLITATFTPWGWVAVGVGVLGNLITSLFDTRTDAEKLRDANNELEDAQKRVNDAYNEFVNASKTHLNAYKNYEKAQDDLKKTAKKLGMTTEDLKKRGEELFNEIKEHPEKIGELSDRDKELYEAYLNHLDAETKLQSASEKLTGAQKDLTEAEKEEVRKQLDVQKVTSDTIGSYEDYRDAVMDAYEKGAISGEEASGRLVEAFNKTKQESKQTFLDDIPGYMQDMMKDSNIILGGIGVEWRSTTDDMKLYTDSLAGKFDSRFGKDIPNSVKKTMDKMSSLNKQLEKMPFGKTWSIYINSKLSGSGNAKGAIYYPPKLAVGGIINQPGRGVPLAMGGERGAEGVIPLTDSQAMSTLGQVIAKNISVNLNNTIEMNGRVISRELKQIQNEEDFAFNGG